MPSENFTTITSVCWTFCAVTVLMSIGRFYIRAKVIEKFYWDDLLHAFATAFLIIMNSVYTGAIPLLMQIHAYQSGESDQAPDYKKYMDINVANSVMAFSCWWSVKFAFLLYYRLIFQVSKTFLRTWWAIFIFTLLTYWTLVASTIAQCGGSASNIHTYSICIDAPSVKFQRRLFIYSYCFNVASDLTAMILPIPYLWRLQISHARKLGITLIFCLTLVVIAFETLRLAESISGTASSNNSIWINMEAAVAVIVSCLPTYSVLISRSQPKQGGLQLRTGTNTHLVGKQRSNPSFRNTGSIHSAGNAA